MVVAGVSAYDQGNGRRRLVVVRKQKSVYGAFLMTTPSAISQEESDPSVARIGDRVGTTAEATHESRRAKGTDRLIDQRQLPPEENDLTRALTRHGLRGDWENLMAEVERHGWYVIPTAPLSASIEQAPALRRVYVGMISNESHVTVSGDGSTIIEALGWAVVHALNASVDAVAS